MLNRTFMFVLTGIAGTGTVLGCDPGASDGAAPGPGLEQQQAALVTVARPGIEAPPRPERPAEPGPIDKDKPELGGEPDQGSNAGTALMAAQAPLVEAAMAIRELATREGSEGYAGIELDVKRGLVKVAWKGEPPASLQETIRSRDIADVRIEVSRARHSQAELSAAARDLMGVEGRAVRGALRVGARADGGGLSVGVASELDARSLRGRKVPVSVEVAVEPALVPLSRSNDSPPYWAGALVHPATGGNCSTGFAVFTYFLIPAWETSRGILTAEHCGANTPYFDGGWDYMGQAGPGGLSDSVYIQTSSSARIYDGGVGVNEFSKPVDSVVGNFPGQYLCTSGAATGVHCDIVTNSVGNFVSWPNGQSVFDVVMATRLGGQVAAGPGDSGGPVFTLTANYTKVRAAGHIIGGYAYTAACPYPGQSGCSNVVAFVDMAATLQDRGVALLTQ